MHLSGYTEVQEDYNLNHRVPLSLRIFAVRRINREDARAQGFAKSCI